MATRERDVARQRPARSVRRRGRRARAHGAGAPGRSPASDLSELSDVSQRHLAQLESGDGNISLALLHRVAAALDNRGRWVGRRRGRGARSPRSIAPRPSPSVNASRTILDRRAGRRQRIALIGLRGAGKSTLGRLLAEAMQSPFIELNREIESQSGMAGQRSDGALWAGGLSAVGAAGAGASRRNHAIAWCSPPPAASSPSRRPLLFCCAHFHTRLAEGGARGAHAAGARARRRAADGGQPQGDGGIERAAARPRGALRQRRRHRRHQRPLASPKAAPICCARRGRSVCDRLRSRAFSWRISHPHTSMLDCKLASPTMSEQRGTPKHGATVRRT